MKTKLLDGLFNLIDFLDRHIRVVAAIAVAICPIILWYVPVSIGTAFIISISIFLIGIFSLKYPKKSLVNLFIFAFILLIVSSPIIACLALEKQGMANASQLIDRNHSKIIEMTEEFQNEYLPTYYDIIDWNDAEFILDEVESYVYEKIPYYYNAFSFSDRFPSTSEVMSNMKSSCTGRALVGYSILKNLGYNVYIVYSWEQHAWIRLYQGDSYIEDFTVEHNGAPWIIFNEERVIWCPLSEQIPHILVNGIHFDEYMPSDFPYNLIQQTEDSVGVNLLDLFAASPLVIPVWVSTVLVLIRSNEKRRWNYFLTLLLGAVIVNFIGYIGLTTSRMFLPIPIIFAGGIYLRMLIWRFPPKDIHITEIK